MEVSYEHIYWDGLCQLQVGCNSMQFHAPTALFVQISTTSTLHPFVQSHSQQSQPSQKNAIESNTHLLSPFLPIICSKI